MKTVISLILILFASTVCAGEHRCLALNIYHEARGENAEAQMAVAHVTLNRVASPHFPNSICGVVKQGRRDSSGALIRHRCQFSWFCDGRSDKPKNLKAWNRAQRLAKTAIAWHNIGEDFSQGALFYHADYVKPYWADKFEKVVTIGAHIFYR